jgi:hypothetical protein
MKMCKRFVLLFTGLVLLLASSGISCYSAVEEYKSDIGSIMAPHSLALSKYNELVKEHNQVDLSSLSQDEFKDMIHEELSAVTDMYKSSSDAYHQLAKIKPPQELQEAHLTLVKSLGLSEQAYLELKGYLEQAYKTGKPDESIRRKANELLSEANQLLLQAGNEINKYK